jgi:hypothetical protein
MKVFGAVFVAFLAVGPLSAQHRSIAANRYGSLVTGFRSYSGTGQGRRRGAGGIYAYPVYIGAYGFEYGYGYAQPDQPPPVAINQYFGAAPDDREPQGPPSNDADSNFHYYQAPANEDASPSDPSSYYLIAFKDHTIYSAVAYYTEGDTLHYFTSGNVHNQVSLSLVDRQLTEQLNRDRNVAVRLPQ